jgi:hypothetical protein
MRQAAGTHGNVLMQPSTSFDAQLPHSVQQCCIASVPALPGLQQQQVPCHLAIMQPADIANSLQILRSRCSHKICESDAMIASAPRSKEHWRCSVDPKQLISHVQQT